MKHVTVDHVQIATTVSKNVKRKKIPILQFFSWYFAAIRLEFEVVEHMYLDFTDEELMFDKLMYITTCDRSLRMNGP